VVDFFWSEKYGFFTKWIEQWQACFPDLTTKFWSKED